MSTPHPWSREAHVEAAKTDVEAAYRLLSPFLSVHFCGTPTKDDLRSLLRDAYRTRAAINQAIECAEMHFLEAIT